MTPPEGFAREDAGRGRPLLAIGGASVELATPPTVSPDADLSAFAASVELALVAMYTRVAPLLSGVVLTVAKTFASHHQDHANVFNAAAGASAVRAPNAKLLASFSASLAALTSPTDVLNLAYGLENRVAATYQSMIDSLVGTAELGLAASILPVECQHAVVLGTLLGKSAKQTIPVNFQGKDGSLDPGQFPVG